MRERNVKLLSILMLPLIISLAMSFSVINVGSSPGETTMFVDPPSIRDTTLQAPSTFDVHVNISTTELLYSWQFNMSWDPSILTFYSLTYGDFLAGQPEGTSKLWRIATGWCLIIESTIGNYPGVSGSGWLATITFQVSGIGHTVLDINHFYTYIWATNPTPPPTLIKVDPVKENGYFSNTFLSDIRGPENPPGSGLFPPDGQVDMYDFGYCGLEYGSSI